MTQNDPKMITDGTPQEILSKIKKEIEERAKAGLNKQIIDITNENNEIFRQQTAQKKYIKRITDKLGLIPAVGSYALLTVVVLFATYFLQVKNFNGIVSSFKYYVIIMCVLIFDILTIYSLLFSKIVKVRIGKIRKHTSNKLYSYILDKLGMTE